MMQDRMARGWAGGVALSALVALGAAFGVASTANAQATYEVAPRAPEYLYQRTCGYCHGHNVAPIIRGRQLPAALVTVLVRTGQGAMPAFKPTEITNQELAALALWIEQSEVDPQEHGQ